MSTTDVRLVRGVRMLGAGPTVAIRIEAGVVVAIEPDRTSGAGGLIALPALVDLHTHLREPGGERSETIETGSAAALHGGYSDVFAMANTDPVTDRVDRAADIRRRAASASVRVHPVSAATLDMAGAEIVDIAALRSAGVRMFSDDGRCVSDDAQVADILSAVALHGGVFAQHAQSPSIVGDGVIDEPVAAAVGCHGWPSVGEEAIVARDIAIARATGGRLHVCHVSSRRSVDLIRFAKSHGAPVTAEVTPHHLQLTHDDARDRGSLMKVNPPLRSADDVRALREALRDGTIDAVATDHAPHAPELKAGTWQTAAFGYAGIETALAVTVDALFPSGDIDWALVADRMSHAPARIGGLPARGIVPGREADIVLIEETAPRQTAESDLVGRSTNSPFVGMPLRHRIVETIVSPARRADGRKENG